MRRSTRNARFLQWKMQPVRDVKGIRIDFIDSQPEQETATETNPKVISVFLLPMRFMDFPPEFIEKLRGRKPHPCTNCIGMRDGGMFLFATGDILVSVVSNLGEKQLETHIAAR